MAMWQRARILPVPGRAAIPGYPGPGDLLWVRTGRPILSDCTLGEHDIGFFRVRETNIRDEYGAQFVVAERAIELLAEYSDATLPA